MQSNYLESVTKQFLYYKSLGDKAIVQITEEQLFWQFNDDSNSVAIVVKHLRGNMLSRWTDFLTTDGEKEWRNRDEEFESFNNSKSDVLTQWNEGWDCLLNTLKSLSVNDLDKIIYIRNEGHTVMEAINRQLAHYPYHVGQIVYIAKMCTDNKWQTLSIAKGNSKAYNSDKFAQPKKRSHFTDEFSK